MVGKAFILSVTPTKNTFVVGKASLLSDTPTKNTFGCIEKVLVWTERRRFNDGFTDLSSDPFHYKFLEILFREFFIHWRIGFLRFCIVLLHWISKNILISQFWFQLQGSISCCVTSIFFKGPPQLTFTCSKTTIKTLQKVVKCLKLTIKTPERRHWRPSAVFVLNFEHISPCFYCWL